MNVLPLVLALVLMLAVMTVERLDKFKNQTLVKSEYGFFLEKNERKEFNRRQELLFSKSRATHRQLSFRYLALKDLRNKDVNLAKQYRQILIDLMKILYGHARFYKEAEAKNPDFLNEMIDQIEAAADKAPEKTVKRVVDIARLQLPDPDLQYVFYRMLKGTVDRDELYGSERPERERLSSGAEEKQYVSLLTYIHLRKDRPQIQLAPRELLQAIFESDQVAEEVIRRRGELAKAGGSANDFKNEFNSKRKLGLDDLLLDFKITKSDKTIYD